MLLVELLFQIDVLNK